MLIISLLPLLIAAPEGPVDGTADAHLEQTAHGDGTSLRFNEFSQRRIGLAKIIPFANPFLPHESHGFGGFFLGNLRRELGGDSSQGSLANGFRQPTKADTLQESASCSFEQTCGKKLTESLRGRFVKPELHGIRIYQRIQLAGFLTTERRPSLLLNGLLYFFDELVFRHAIKSREGRGCSADHASDDSSCRTGGGTDRTTRQRAAKAGCQAGRYGARALVQRIGPGISFHLLKRRNPCGTVLFLTLDYLVGHPLLLGINIPTSPDARHVFQKLVRHRIPDTLAEKPHPSKKSTTVLGADVIGGDGIVGVGGIVLTRAEFSRILLRRPAELPGELLEGNVRKPCVM